MLTRFKNLFVIAIASLALVATAAFAGYGSAKKYKDQQDIVAIAADNESFSTLVAALKAGGLVETLQGDGPFTVFAPTDEAFAKLPAGTLDMLLKPENKDKLVSILTYHVVPGKVDSSQVVGLESAKTVEGSEIAIETKEGKVRVDNAMVVTVDINASNGIIHVIDTVIMPEA